LSAWTSCQWTIFGVREGYRALKSLSAPLKPTELREIGKGWAPHRTVASWYLWPAPRKHSGQQNPAARAAKPKKKSGRKRAQKLLVHKKGDAPAIRGQ
jgi:hypothetical protein